MEEIRYFEVRLEEVVERLRDYFNSREDVLIAILFGSILRRRVVRDVDVAVCTADKSLEGILRMGWEIEELLKLPVDVVPLEQLSPRLRLRILLGGLPIVRSRTAYTELLKMSISELEDIRIAYSTISAKN